MSCCACATVRAVLPIPILVPVPGAGVCKLAVPIANGEIIMAIIHVTSADCSS